MITKINLNEVASYKNQTALITDKKVNLIYGLNGTGKSTLSNYLHQRTDDRFKNCSVEGLDDDHEILVYNQTFIQENFFEAENLKGIFTLSKENIDYLYSLGYLYNPYSQDFYNPFVQRALKETCVYNLNEQQIQDVNDQFIDDRGGNVLGIEDIESVFLTPKSHWVFGTLAAISPVLSMIFLVTALSFNIFGYFITSSILVCISYLFLNTFIVENTIHEQINLIEGVHPLWNKFKVFIPIIFMLHLPYLYYLLVNSLDNYWKPFLGLCFLYFVVSSFIHRKIANRLAKNYFSTYSWRELQTFAKK